MTAELLIVDDEQEMARLIGAQLSGSGYRVEVVNDGQSALEFVRSRRPDLMLLDVMMPGLDGIEVCRRVREIDNLRTMPIILLTVLTSIRDKRAGFEAGADDYVTKPFNREELELRIAAQLRRTSVNARRNTPKHQAPALMNADNRSLVVLPLEHQIGDTVGAIPRVSVVIPTLNEAMCLPHVLHRIPRWIHELILVDGNSTDNTVEVARELWPDVMVLMQEGAGKGDALRSGIAAAQGDIIVTLDGDGSTDPAEIPAFVGSLISGADFAKGSRFLQGADTVDMPNYRKLGNLILTQVANFLFGTRLTDITYGYQATWHHCKAALALEIEGWSQEIISSLRVARSGMRVVEVPCFEHRRVAGSAKLKALPAGWEILKAIVKEWVAGRDRRMIWENREVIGDNVFTPAMQLLRRETLELMAMRSSLSPESYKRAASALKSTYLSLLELGAQHPDAIQLQQKCREEVDKVWGFVEGGVAKDGLQF